MMTISCIAKKKMIPSSSSWLLLVDATSMMMLMTMALLLWFVPNNDSVDAFVIVSPTIKICIEIPMTRPTMPLRPWMTPTTPTKCSTKPNHNSDDDDTNENDTTDNSNGIIYYDDFADLTDDGMIEEYYRNNEEDPNQPKQEFQESEIKNNKDDHSSKIFNEQQQQQKQGNDAGNNKNNDSNSNIPSSLYQRIQMIQQQEIYQQSTIQRNWDLGNWQVRGFQIIDDDDDDDTDHNLPSVPDDTDPTRNAEDRESKSLFLLSSPSEEENKFRYPTKQPRSLESTGRSPRLRIGPIIPYRPNIIIQSNDDNDDDDSDDDDHDDHDNDLIWVSRSDGTIFCIQLGTEPMTTLSSSPKQNNFEDDIPKNRKKPFRIMTQFSAHDPITAMAVVFERLRGDDDEEEEADTTYRRWLYTATKHREHGHGVIRRWKIISSHDNDDDEQTKISVIPDDILGSTPDQPAHTTEAPFSLKVMSLVIDNDKEIVITKPTQYHVLVSVDSDGIAIWNIVTHEWIGRYDISSMKADNDNNFSIFRSHDDDKNEIKITCIDTDHHKYIYLGTSSGEVIALSLQEMIMTASSEQQPSQQSLRPVGRWIASTNGKSITAITCGGVGIMGQRRQRPLPSSSTPQHQPSPKRSHNNPVVVATKTSTMKLYTGTSDGMMKQWEVFERNGSNNDHHDVILEYWPKLSTQRIQQSAHIFPSIDSVASVTAMAAISSSYHPNKHIMIASYSDSSIRIWDANTGKELYAMDLGSHHQPSHESGEGTMITTTTSDLCLLPEKNMFLSYHTLDPYVCIHDFSIDNPEDDDQADYELDMPEYNYEK